VTQPTASSTRLTTQASPAIIVAKPILPGATVGVLGSGQLGRMFAIAARRMGYRVHTFSPDTDTPTGQVADKEIVADYDDLDAVAKFAQGVSVVTFEFENVSSAATEAAARFVPVRPAGSVLHTTQHRLREKSFLSANGFPVTPFAVVRSPAELREAFAKTASHSGGGVLKTAGWGYDGKGQTKLAASADHAALDAAWAKLNTKEAVLEAFVDFKAEVSVVAARGIDGLYVDWGVIENRHANHILDLSTSPADVSDRVRRDAQEIARGILDKLGVVGVLCVEFFLTRDDQLLVNELAPRPHNSGHLTFDACVTSQFEQQLRAICGLPLGDTALYRPAAMVNLLGDVWYRPAPGVPGTTVTATAQFEPNWAAALSLPDVKLHLYGKAQPRPGRKMGHLTAMADTPQAAASLAQRARAALTG